LTGPPWVWGVPWVFSSLVPQVVLPPLFGVAWRFKYLFSLFPPPFVFTCESKMPFLGLVSGSHCASFPGVLFFCRFFPPPPLVLFSQVFFSGILTWVTLARPLFFSFCFGGPPRSCLPQFPFFFFFPVVVGAFAGGVGGVTVHVSLLWSPFLWFAAPPRRSLLGGGRVTHNISRCVFLFVFAKFWTFPDFGGKGFCGKKKNPSPVLGWWVFLLSFCRFCLAILEFGFFFVLLS